MNVNLHSGHFFFGWKMACENSIELKLVWKGFFCIIFLMMSRGNEELRLSECTQAPQRLSYRWCPESQTSFAIKVSYLTKIKKKINHTFLTNIDHWNIKNEQSWIKEIYAWTYDLFISLINEIRWSITRIPGIPTACFLFNIFLAFSCKKMFFATIKCKKCSIFHNWILKFFNYKDAIGSLHFAITKI